MTYRRGTGLVSGGTGTQGTYTALDPEGLGVAGNESFQSRSPGLSTKAGRRAAMHITGPTLVTVPLHITSNLALGVLQGGGADRVVHRARDKDGGDRGEGKEGGENVDRKDNPGMEKDVEEGIKLEEEETNYRRKERGGVVDVEGNLVAAEGGGEEKETKEEKEDFRRTPSPVMRGESREQRAGSVNSKDEENVEESDYIGKNASLINNCIIYFLFNINNFLFDVHHTCDCDYNLTQNLKCLFSGLRFTSFSDLSEKH